MWLWLKSGSPPGWSPETCSARSRRCPHGRRQSVATHDSLGSCRHRGAAAQRGSSRLVVPSRNFTLPDAPAVTVAFKVTVWPNIDGLGEAVRVVVVAAGFTVTVAVELSAIPRHSRPGPNSSLLPLALESCSSPPPLRRLAETHPRWFPEPLVSQRRRNRQPPSMWRSARC